MQPLWIFLHLPKTGGTTFEAHCCQHLAWDETFIELSNWGRSFRRNERRLPFQERPMEERNKAVVLSGHHAYYGIHNLVPGKEPRYFTFVREPAARCISEYNFRRSRGESDLDFDTWYETVYLKTRRNAMALFYAERLLNTTLDPDRSDIEMLARKMLDRCWLIGLTEKMECTLSFLFEQMGLPIEWRNRRVAGVSRDGLRGLQHPKEGERVRRFVRLNREIRDRVWSDHAIDTVIYQYAVEHVAAKKRRPT